MPRSWRSLSGSCAGAVSGSAARMIAIRRFIAAALLSVATRSYTETMTSLSTLAAAPAALLTARRQTLAVAESAAGGLISAALLAVPGASAYFVGGGVIYTGAARERLLGIGKEEMQGLRAATEPYARLVARRVRERLGTTWGLSETGAAGPTGNRYGDAAGHACIAVSGPVELALTVETGRAEREQNMQEFARRALELLSEALQKTR